MSEDNRTQKLRGATKKWYARNRERQLVYYREYYKKNAQKLKEKRCLQ